MQTDIKFEDLVHYNDGFKTKLVGTKEQVADRILLLKSLGIYLGLLTFLHYEEDSKSLGRRCCHLLRSWKKRGGGRTCMKRLRGQGVVVGRRRVMKLRKMWVI
jgi:alkanesulfonate monooxygenase